MSDSPVAAVFSIGQTAGGCEFALRWIVQEANTRPDLFFFFGHAEPGQSPSPVSAVHALLTHPEFQDLRHAGEQSTNAFSLDRAYTDALDLVRKIEAGGYHRVYLGITGGTNPMVAALFHAAMNELTPEVIPIYVQAKPAPGGQQNSIELIPGMRTRDAIQVERTLGLCRRGQLSAARGLAETLAERGRAGFVRKAVLAFARWDNFEYSVAPEIRELATRGIDFSEDRLLEPLLDTLSRYTRVVHHAAEMEAVFAKPEEFSRASKERGWEHQVRNRAYWLPLDALANGLRRIEEGRTTDAVMRAYRAVEIAIHCRLFALGVHPSALDWERPPLAEVAPAWKDEFGSVPQVVAFEHAVKLLGLVTELDFSDTDQPRHEIQICRNNTYLEHGYQRVEMESGRRTLKRAEKLLERILWDADTEKLLETLKMIF